MKSVYVNAIGIAAPGLDGWQNARDVLAGKHTYDPQPLDKHQSQLLPPNERRRATELVRLAFRACEDALTGDYDPSQFASVFASSGGDYNIFDQICRTLKTPERAVSPTQFHNSVHNAAAGYWGIATKAQAASTSLSGYDATFATGLLEAILQLEVEGTDILYAAFDVKPPMPILEKRKIQEPFALALLLSNKKSAASISELKGDLLSKTATESRIDSAFLEAVRLGNPAARSLPLLEAIAKMQSKTLYFSMPGNGVTLKVDISPC